MKANKVRFNPLSTHQLLANAGNAMRFVGQAGKILEQMQEFWANGTPIHPGSLLANEFIDWGKRVMRGPLDISPKLVLAAPDLLQALQALLPLVEDPRGCIKSNRDERINQARAALAKATE